MIESKTSDIETSTHHKVPLFSKYVIFSIILFVIILIIGTVAFLFTMQQVIRSNKSTELTKLLEVEKTKLEMAVDREIAIALKLSTSTAIQRYFEKPGSRDLERVARREIKSYRTAVKSGSIFWVNDADKLFYLNDQAPYTIDPSLPANSWYDLTLNKTETYNLNISYNAGIKKTSLWINVPVLNSSLKPIGIIGTGIDLSAFLHSLYRGNHGKSKIYFFNTLGEITGADNIEIISSKKQINDELYSLGSDVLARAKTLNAGQMQTFAVSDGQAAIISMPMLGWYAIAFLPNSIWDFKTPITAIFFLGILLIAFILVLTCIFVSRLLKTLQKAMASIEGQHKIIMSGITYASEIQRNLLPPKRILVNAFFDYSVIWEPRDVVGGDIYWLKHFDKGSVLCVCDCTGHGTPGALLTMLVMSALESEVMPENCDDTADIVWNIDRRLKAVFNLNHLSTSEMKDGCDLAVMFISNEGSIVLSAGHINVFVCNGKEVQRIRGQKIFVGEGSLKSKGEIKTIRIPFNPDNKFYVASDGLYDQPGGENLDPFGYRRFEKLILANHSKEQNTISNIIWEKFEEYRGEESRVDDFELITFQPQIRRKK